MIVSSQSLARQTRAGNPMKALLLIGAEITRVEERNRSQGKSSLTAKAPSDTIRNNPGVVSPATVAARATNGSACTN
jgi:hypothetical protein